jgi:Mg-chelatase subunit ChlD
VQSAEGQPVITCPNCSRSNPAPASFCHHDGASLVPGCAADPSRLGFPAPFVFPSGRRAGTFDELVAACLEEWASAVALLREGAFTAFLRGVGRADLAEQARQAALFPDSDWALSQLLDRLPTHATPDGKLDVATTTLDFGRVRAGQDVEQPLRLRNAGEGCLYGTVTSDAPWLSVSRSHFGGPLGATIAVRARGLRASPTPLVGQLTVESSGGRAVVSVKVEVPALTFASGVLAGARTPRQLVEKAKAAPGEAARLFESGEVARWYERNGWTYPLKPGQGSGEMARYFVALGLQPISHEASEPAEQPWFASQPPAPSVQPAPAGWQTIKRAARPAKNAPAPAVPLPAPDRRPSRLWLLVLLPVALMAVVSLAGVGIVLSLPGPGSRQATKTDSALAEDKQGAKEDDQSPGVQPEDPPLKVARRDDLNDGSRKLLPRLKTPILTVPEFVVPQVEVVFVLDTTGSMGGLLRAAQDKIWSICNQIAGGKPAPALKVGLVAYRDKGDAYVTKVTDLSRDLDAVHQELLALRAAGGGDIPESVNQALDEAVNMVSWSTDKKTLRIVFLVGDAPPHLDYKDDVPYPVTCKKAVEKGIVINAVQCGKDAACEKHWKLIAEQGGGEYVAIAQTGGVRVVASPFDESMAKLLGELMDTALIYGAEQNRQAGQRMVQSAKRLRGPAAADRAAFAAKTKRLGPNDLLDDVNARLVKLESVKADALPDEMKKLDALADRKEQLEKVRDRRAELYRQVLELEKKRSDHVKKAPAGGKDGFDEQVLNLLRKQAKKFDVAY